MKIFIISYRTFLFSQTTFLFSLKDLQNYHLHVTPLHHHQNHNYAKFQKVPLLYNLICQKYLPSHQLPPLHDYPLFCALFNILKCLHRQYWPTERCFLQRCRVSRHPLMQLQLHHLQESQECHPDTHQIPRQPTYATVLFMFRLWQVDPAAILPGFAARFFRWKLNLRVPSASPSQCYVASVNCHTNFVHDLITILAFDSVRDSRRSSIRGRRLSGVNPSLAVG